MKAICTKIVELDLECLAVEVWIEDFPIRVVVAYGPQLGDDAGKKQNFWAFIEQQAVIAQKAGAGFILQMDGNAHLGTDVINGDVNEQNVNGKYFVQFLERMPSLSLINSLPLCEGKITRMRKTTRGVEQSILDVYVTCDKILPYITKMKVDESREYTLTNFSSVKKVGRVIKTDHNPVILEINLQFSKLKTERIEIFNFKNREGQQLFQNLTTNTSEFSDCFQNNLPFETQAMNWRKVLNKFFHKSFKKIRITNKPKEDKSKIGKLMDERNKLKRKHILDTNEEEELNEIESLISEACQDANRNKVIDNFKDIVGNNGNLSHQGVWKLKRNIFRKSKPHSQLQRKI